MPRLLLVLDDDRNRLRGFEEIASRLGEGWVVRSWRDASSMLAELDGHLQHAQLISLDHDLYRDSPADPDPGSGRSIADYLAKCKPRCPVIVHSTNTDAAWGMHNVLRSRGWTVELVHHLSQPKWIEELWLPIAARVVAANREAQPPRASTLTLSEYRTLARSLPVPTQKHIRAFAKFVAGAHSWYKHLHLLPAKEPIQIFLDPAAGMQLTQAADGRVTAAVREGSGLHYSWLRTAEHRERFGHLAFSRSSGTSVSLQSTDGGRFIGGDDAPCVYVPSSQALHRLPEEALIAGRAHISGIAHELASSRNLWERLIAGDHRFDEVLDPGEGLEISKRILDRCGVLKGNPSLAEPGPHREDILYRVSLEALDAPLHRLVEAERERQIAAIEAAAIRLIRLIGSAAGVN